MRSALVAAVFVLSGFAQGREARSTGENGLKIGAGRLHPYVEVEGRYDSNVLYFAGNPTGDLVLHLRPGFDLQVPGQSVKVGLDARLDWSKYLGVRSSATDYSRLFAQAALDLVANPDGRIGFALEDLFRRSDETESLSLATAVISDYNRLTVNLPMRPGGGALLLNVGGDWQLESFEPFGKGGLCTASGSGACSHFSYHQVTGRGQVRWLFLPRTAVVLEADAFARLPRDPDFALQVSGLHALAGLEGLVTPRVAATVKAGYGDTFGSAGPSYRTWLTNLEAEYVGSDVANLRLGYVHSFAADTGDRDLSLYGVNRVYTEGKLLVGGRLTLAALAEWDRLGYVLGAADGATAQIVRFTPSVEYELLRWVRVAVGYTFTYRTTEGPLLETLSVFNYARNETWLRVAFAY